MSLPQFLWISVGLMSAYQSSLLSTLTVALCPSGPLGSILETSPPLPPYPKGLALKN